MAGKGKASGKPKWRQSDREAFEAQASQKKRKKISLFGAIWYVVTIPFRIIFHLTRNIKWYFLWPLRIGLSLAFVGFVISAILIGIYGTASQRYDISEVLNMPERTIVLDRKNREIGRLHGENRKRVGLNEVPPIFIKSLLLREDKRFYSHGGVDWFGVGRAIHQVYKHRRTTQGASTLTMQLAKTTFNHRERDINTKLTEIALAKRIESTYSKDQILEAYINRIFWGHTFMGISAAARGYFNKIPADLTISECAMLAGIIYGPNQFSPYKNPEKAKYVRDIVLGLLKDNGDITEAQYQDALKETIITKRPESRSEENYTMDLIRKELDNILEDEDIRLGGLVVRTTLDLDLQNRAIDALNKRLEALEGRKGYPHQTRKSYLAKPKEVRENTPPNYVQGAVVVIDNATGALLVVLGGRDAEESRFNRAFQARRQIGSLFKPFVYAAFFEKGYLPTTLVSDNRIAPGEIKGAPGWSPRNSGNTYTGNRPASYGLIKSRNTMSVRVGQAAGLQNVVKYAKLCGFQGKIAMTPALYLGTWEASPLDVASAYTVFANGGVRPTPYLIESIFDTKENPIYFTRKTSRTAYSPKAATLTSQILQQVTKPGGTAGGTAAMGFDAPSGGKTGTTNNYTNAWFAGFSSELSCSVWVGFDRQRKIIDDGYGGVLALPIWVDVMKSARESGYPCGPIRSKSSSRNRVTLICRESHHIANSGCQAAGTAYYETMLANTPQTMCEIHIPLATSDEESEQGTIPMAQPDGQLAPSNDDIPLAEPAVDDIPLADPA